jgi:hypothetical protein
MFTSPKYEALQIEYHVFQRLFDHWEELEKESLPIVLERILAEISKEQEETFANFWAGAQKFM